MSSYFSNQFHICLFAFGISSQSRILDSYGDVTITSEGHLVKLTAVVKCLATERSLTCFYSLLLLWNIQIFVYEANALNRRHHHRSFALYKNRDYTTWSSMCNACSYRKCIILNHTRDKMLIVFLSQNI